MASRGWVHRAYQGDADLHRLLDALAQAHARHTATALMHPGDLIWELFQTTHVDPHRAIELWESTDGSLVGFGLFEDGDFDTQCFMLASDQQLTFESEALLLARERARQAGAGALRTEILASEALRADLLIAEGFVPDEARVTSRGERNTGTLRLRQPLDTESLQVESLDHSSGEAPPPPGFLVRSVGDEKEWAERVQLHQTVWASTRVTLEAYRQLRAAPVYRPDLDLVAVASDGTFAAYTIVWYDPSSQLGEFEPVGTHPDFRHRGIGRAVTLEGLHRLRKLGARQALVSSSADNPASIRLYESVGFAVADRGRFYLGPL
jgi:GNAT superfamily N-acetyltransferase